jgi:D-beta-D-heptose 7-phosphate kinase/D-beta-D-heptose 1-phosphate adenosyltransferase
MHASLMQDIENRDLLLRAVTSGFSDKKILVVGDIMLDRYLLGEVKRISPESPVPVVRLTGENEVPGGAANVALNIACLGIPVALAGYTGMDDDRQRLFDILSDANIDTGMITGLENWPTITKTRVIGRHQQIVRIDRETLPPPSGAMGQQLLRSIKAQLSSGDTGLLILSDYAKGVLSAVVCHEIIHHARQLNIPVLVDPKGTDYTKYSKATCITPNRSELASAVKTDEQPLDTLIEAGRILALELDTDFLCVTLGEHGAVLIEREETVRIPSVAREVFDVSGAGDTFIAVMAAGLLSGLSRVDSVCLANVASGIVVGKAGTAPVTARELIRALRFEEALKQSEKICTLPAVLERVAVWRAKGERIVFTNGCFDLLHAGHVTYLEKAKKLGNRLVVGLNTDRSVRALKGQGRPVIPENERAQVLAALAAVDAVVFFDEETPVRLIKAIQPDVLAKGADYTREEVVGAELVESWGGEVALVELVNGKSSSLIIEAIKGARHS